MAAASSFLMALSPLVVRWAIPNGAQIVSKPVGRHKGGWNGFQPFADAHGAVASCSSMAAPGAQSAER